MPGCFARRSSWKRRTRIAGLLRWRIAINMWRAAVGAAWRICRTLSAAKKPLLYPQILQPGDLLCVQ